MEPSSKVGRDSSGPSRSGISNSEKASGVLNIVIPAICVLRSDSIMIACRMWRFGSAPAVAAKRQLAVGPLRQVTRPQASVPSSVTTRLITAPAEETY
jgi:hypothetical protein